MHWWITEEQEHCFPSLNTTRENFKENRLMANSKLILNYPNYIVIAVLSAKNICRQLDFFISMTSVWSVLFGSLSSIFPLCLIHLLQPSLILQLPVLSVLTCIIFFLPPLFIPFHLYGPLAYFLSLHEGMEDKLHSTLCSALFSI